MKPPIPRIQTHEFDNTVIDQINEERLRQSRIIAQQQETIGKLHRLLARVTKSGSSFSLGASASTLLSDSPMSGELLFDAETQTTDSGKTMTDGRAALVDSSAVCSLQHQLQQTLSELYSEKQKISRISQVCNRISSANGSSVSPKFAEWISLGLEDPRFSMKPIRGGSYDDAVEIFRNRNFFDSISLPARASSEGGTPQHGLDLDMIYGNPFGEEGPNQYGDAGSSFRLLRGWSMAAASIPMSPRAGKGFQEVSRLLEQLCGYWWTGFSVVRLEKTRDTVFSTELTGKWGVRTVTVSIVEDCVANIHGNIFFAVQACLGNDIVIRGEYRKEPPLFVPHIEWGNGQTWTKSMDGEDSA